MRSLDYYQSILQEEESDIKPVEDRKGQSIAGDYVDAFQAGVLGTTSALARGATLGSENTVSRYLDQKTQDQYDTMNPESLEAMQGFGFDDDLSLKDSSTLHGFGLAAAQGMGSFVPSMAAGAGAGAVIGKIGGGVLTKALSSGMKTQASRASAATRASNATRTLGYATAGAAMIGGSTAKSVSDDAMNQAPETLFQSKDFQDRYRALRTQGIDQAEAFETARKDYANELAKGAFPGGAGVGAISMGIGGPIMEKVIRGKYGSGRLGNAIVGFLTEAPQEFFEESWEQLLSNRAAKQYDPSRDEMKGVVGGGLTAAAIGGVTGGVVGGLSGRKKPSDTTDKKDEFTADNEEPVTFPNGVTATRGEIKDAIKTKLDAESPTDLMSPQELEIRNNLINEKAKAATEAFIIHQQGQAGSINDVYEGLQQPESQGQTDTPFAELPGQDNTTGLQQPDTDIGVAGGDRKRKRDARKSDKKYDAPILNKTKAAYLRGEIKRQGFKKTSPGFKEAFDRLSNDYEMQKDIALASLPFDKFSEHVDNKDLSESLKLQAWQSLRDKYEIDKADALGVQPVTESTLENPFEPTHTLSDGTKVIFDPDNNVFVDETKSEYEPDGYETPIKLQPTIGQIADKSQNKPTETLQAQKKEELVPLVDTEINQAKSRMPEGYTLIDDGESLSLLGPDGNPVTNTSGINRTNPGEIVRQAKLDSERREGEAHKNQAPVKQQLNTQATNNKALPGVSESQLNKTGDQSSNDQAKEPTFKAEIEQAKSRMPKGYTLNDDGESLSFSGPDGKVVDKGFNRSGYDEVVRQAILRKKQENIPENQEKSFVQGAKQAGLDPVSDNDGEEAKRISWSNIDTVSKGDKVRVSDGSPRPKDKNKKQLASWLYRNFDGFVHKIDKDLGYIYVDKSGSGVMTIGVRPDSSIITFVDNKKPGLSPSTGGQRKNTAEKEESESKYKSSDSQDTGKTVSGSPKAENEQQEPVYIGLNEDGNKIFEKDDGSRYIEIGNLIENESIAIVPSREGGETVRNARKDKFIPVDSKQKESDYGKANKIFTEDAAAKARKILKAKLGQLSSGIDPEIMQAGIMLAGYHIEAGARGFGNYAKAMIDDLGESVRPYLRSFYEGVRHYPGMDNKDMTSSSQLDAAEKYGIYHGEKWSFDGKPAREVTSVDENNIIFATKDDAGKSSVSTGNFAQQKNRWKRVGNDSTTTNEQNRNDGIQGMGDEGKSPVRSGRGRTVSATKQANSDTNDNDAILETVSAENVPEDGGNESAAGVGVRSGMQGMGPNESQSQGRDTVAGGQGTGGTGVDADGTGGRSGGRAGATGGSGKNARGRKSASGEKQTGEIEQGQAVSDQDKNKVDGDTKTKLGNYHIDNPEMLIGGTPKVRFARNKAAIETYHGILEENREPTQEERDVLAAYIGWGSFGQELFQGSWERPVYRDGWKEENEWLREHLGESAWKSAQNSIINAHYTDPPTVQALWRMAEKLGFKGGRVLEPSMGIGNFFGLMPVGMMERSELTGIELDETTGGMAKMLYPNANVQIKGYEKSQTADGFYDLIIGNWPFAKQGPSDRRYNKLGLSLHDYFFVKGLDQLREGGLMIGITSAGTMDKIGKIARMEMMKKANLVAAFRMPMGAFDKYAGTSVVADIIILQKKGDGVQEISNAWLEVEALLDRYGEPSKRRDGTEVRVNQYWAANKDNVLGDMTVGHGTTQGRDGMIVKRRDNYADVLANLQDRLPEAIMTERKYNDNVRYISNNTQDRQNAIVVGDDGNLYVVQGERLADLRNVSKYEVKDAQKTADRKDQLKRLAEIRKLYGALIDAEMGGKANVESLRKDLMNAYQSFKKAHGSIAESYAIGQFKKVGDPFHPALAALEINTGTDDKPVYSPAAILSKPTTRGKRKLENPSVSDAFILVRNESAEFIDVDRIAELSKASVEEVVKNLTGSGALFQTPSGNFEVRDIYLSGNVRRKLREAIDAQEAGQDMSRNIEALKKVLPKDTPYFAIEASLGANWVGSKYYQQFIADLLGVTGDDMNGISVELMPRGWKVKIEKWINNKPEAKTLHGVPYYPFSSLMNAAFSGESITIKYKDEDGEHVDEARTKEVNEKKDKLRDEFKGWIWKDSERRIALEKAFNETMNAFASPDFDGSFMRFDGMALQFGGGEFNLRQHQVNAIWRGVANGRGIYAHEVGTGKTLTMGGIAVESRRYGLAKKPLIFAHNANSASVARDIQAMYPGAKILYIDNLSPKTIKQRLYQIANDDWDAVVVPHSLLKNFALSEETLMEMAEADIAALEAEAIESASEEGLNISDMMDNEEELRQLRGATTAKQLVKERNRIIENIKKQAERASKENAIAFEKLGVDMLIVDESHAFKKPPLSTKMRVKGLNTSSSGESIAMHYLTQYVRNLNNGKGVHVFTGTPITNTLNEIYNQMRYVMSDTMDEAGVADWDSWFNTFAGTLSDVELTSTGEYESVTRLSGFYNVAELRRFAGQYMDIVFADEMPEFKPRTTKSGKTLHDNNLTDAERDELMNGRTENPIGRPYKKVINDTAPMSPAQKTILHDLIRLARSFKNASKKVRRELMLNGDPSSPVIVETNAAKVGLDPRLYDLTLEDHPDYKANRVVKNVMKHYQEHPLATQVIFMEKGFTDSVTRTKSDEQGRKIVTKHDAFNLSKDIVNKLVKQGIPREQIAIVTGKTSKEKRKELADKMNSGEVRVIIGSTSTLGVGVNIQENLRAMHNLDAPWMPGELEQRNGRGYRQGNKWNTVLEYRYLTEGIDGRRWQVLAIKQRFIMAFLKADEDTRVIEGDAADVSESESIDDISESLSAAAGDPRLMMREKLKGDVNKLENKQRNHDYGIQDAKNMANKLRRGNKKLQDSIAQLEDDASHLAGFKGKDFVIRIGDKKYTKRDEADLALESAIKFANIGKIIGNFNGFEIKVSKTTPIVLSRKASYSALASIRSIEANLRNIPKWIEKDKQNISENEQSIIRMEEAAITPFGQADQLAKKKALLKQLDKDIELFPVAAPSWLREGAPVGTDAFVDGKKVAIEGHRWGNDNWFVLVDDGKGKATVVPYTEIMDENNTPVYESRDFIAPEVLPDSREAGQGGEDTQSSGIGAPDVRYSLSGERARTLDAKAKPYTVKSLVSAFKQTLDREFGSGWTDRLLSTGKFKVITSSEADAIVNNNALFSSKNGDILGFYNPSDDTTYFVANNIKEGDDLKGLMLHEISVHALHLGKTSREFQAILNRLNTLKLTNPAVKSAFKSVPPNTKPEHLLEEAAGYLVQNHPELRWSQKLIAWFRNAIRTIGQRLPVVQRLQFFKWANSLNEQDIVYMATAALKTAPESLVFDGNATGDVSYSIAPPQRTPAWRRWFGKSKMVSGGQPITFYHGTNADFIAFDTAQLGHFFTRKKDDAAQYGGKTLEVFLSIQNPYIVTAELLDMRMGEDPVKFRESLKKKGYDGIFIKDAGYAVIFQSHQAKITSNQAPSFSSDIRYSKRDPFFNPPPAEPIYKEIAQSVKEQAEKLTDRLRSGHYGVYSARQLVMMARDKLPVMQNFMEAIQDREATQGHYKRLADKLFIDHWENLSKKDNKRISFLMNESTLADVDLAQRWSGVDGDMVFTQGDLDIRIFDGLVESAKSIDADVRVDGKHRFIFDNDVDAQAFWQVARFQFKKTENGERFNTWKQRSAQLESMPEDAKIVYSKSNELHKNLFDARINALSERIQEKVLDGKKASALVDALRQNFESSSLNWYYAPLIRFGDYWVYSDHDGTPFFEAFETEAQQRRRLAEYAEAGYEIIGHGKKLENMSQIQGVDEGFVAQVQAVLFDNIDPVQASDIQDQIYQMYLSTLPDVSMRKHSMHRKGTAGYHEDASRSFAHSQYHGARQLSSMINNGKMIDTLEIARETLNVVNSKRKRQEMKDEIEALELLSEEWETLDIETIKENIEAREDDAIYKQALKFRKRFETSDQYDEHIYREIEKRKLIMEMADNVGEDSRHLTDTIAELQKSYLAMTQPNVTALDSFVQQLNSMNFIGMLGFGLSSGLVNMASTPMVAVPLSIGRFKNLSVKEVSSEYANASIDLIKAVAKGMKDVDGNLSFEQMLSGDEKRAFDMFTDQMDRSTTMGYHLIGVSDEGFSHGGPIEKFKRMSAWWFHHTERVNRDVTLIASYRLGRKSGLNHDAAIAVAREIMYDSQGDYAKDNRFRFGRGPLGALATQFKIYQQNIYFQYGQAFLGTLDYVKGDKSKRDSARTFAALMAMQTAFAGMLSYPASGALMMMLNMIGGAFDDPDDPWDTEKEIKLGLIELSKAVGMDDSAAKKFSHAVTRGAINAFLGIDLSSRLELKNIMFREPIRELEGADEATRLLASIFGPTGSTIQSWFQALKYMNDGELWRGAEAALPKATRDALQAIRFAKEDARSMRGDLVKEIEASEAIMKALGFAPSQLSLAYDERKIKKDAEQAILNTRKKLMTMIIQANKNNDNKMRVKVSSAIEDFNRRNPTVPITYDSILQSMRARERISGGMQAGVYINPKLAHVKDQNLR